MENPSTLGPQFRGWFRPDEAAHSGARRTGAGIPKQAGWQERVEAALADHPKPVNLGMLRNGLVHMGVAPNDRNMSALADTLDKDPAAFHDLVERARKHTVGMKQKEAEAKNQRKRAKRGV